MVTAWGGGSEQTLKSPDPVVVLHKAREWVTLGWKVSITVVETGDTLSVQELEAKHAAPTGEER